MDAKEILNWDVLDCEAFKGYIEKYGAESLGSFNVSPRNFRPVTDEEFAKETVFSYSIIAIAYRQFLRDFDGNKYGRLIICKLFLTSTGAGYAISAQNKEVNFYRFDFCRHQTTSKGVGNCLTEYTCSICNRKWTVDSSD